MIEDKPDEVNFPRSKKKRRRKKPTPPKKKLPYKKKEIPRTPYRELSDFRYEDQEL